MSSALEAWTRLLGAANVHVDTDARAAVETATFATSQRVPALIRPANTSEVRECMRIASEHGARVSAISTGRNWGYGSRVPVADGVVVMQLDRMDRITDFDESLAHVTVEPGVTFKKLYDFLATRGSGLMMSVTGSSPEGSLVGNALERGLGYGPYGDRFAHVCGLEVVLPTGEIMNTGFARFGSSVHAAPVHRWGVGPSFDGLFSQSNLGIVTRMTQWLLPRPRHAYYVRFVLARDEQLEGVVLGLRELRMHGVVNEPVSLVNAHRAVGSASRFPWEEAGEARPLPASLLDKMKRRAGISGGEWAGLIAVHSASADEARARCREIERVLRGSVGSLRVIGPKTEQLARAVRVPYRALTGVDPVLALAKLRHGANVGVPTGRDIAAAYWRKRGEVPTNMDPDRDRCGLIWCCPTVPLDPVHVRAAVRIVVEIVTAGGFEPGITLRCVTERCAEVVALIVYDRDEPGEDARAMACYERLLGRLVEDGYLPYRLGIQSMSTLPGACDDSSAVQRRIKAALDPKGVLAPGRYEPARDT